MTDTRRTPSFTLIGFYRPVQLLNMNQRLHWRAHARLVKQWRTAAMYAASELGPPSARHHGPCRVSVELPVPDTRRRDPANYFATVKPIVDGLVDAGVWPDDTPDHVVTEEPRLVVNLYGLVVVRLTPITTEGTATP